MSMWEPFNVEARNSIMLAQESAVEAGNHYIGTEHMLIGVVSVAKSAAAKLLTELGVAPDEVAKAAREIIGSAPAATVEELIFTPNGKRAIELAFAEARALDKNYIGSEHLLLGILGTKGVGSRVLGRFQIDVAALRRKASDVIARRPSRFAYDHVQLAMPAGKEDEARSFYGGLLGMEEVSKPSHLQARGGVWFASGSTKLHLGVDPHFRPAAKAHPALRCTDYAELTARLRAAGITIQTEPYEDRLEHAYINDPFGNRIELIG